MRIRYLLGVACLALVAVGCLPPASDFQTLDTGLKNGQTGWTPDAPQNPSANSTIVDNRTANLIWRPNQPNSYLGTSLESDDLGLVVNAGDELTVTYGLSSSTANFVNTMPAADSIRLFAYLDNVPSSPGNRPATAPNCSAAAPVGVRTGTLTCVVTADGTLGYTGLTYDTSNGGVQGRVRFTDLKLNGELVLFS